MTRRPRPDERGIALLTTLLVAFAVSAIALAAVMMTLNAKLVTKNGERAGLVDAAALAGLEEARSRINGQRSLYPSSGYVTLESNAPVKDASNTVIPKVTRSTYIGPTGVSTGQYGVVGSIITVAQDSFGNKVVRRLEINQESFSKFAYFTNFESDTAGNTIVFGGGDQILGPVHSNDQLKMSSSGTTPVAIFFDQVTSAASSILNQSRGQFNKPPILSAPRVPMPTVADLNMLDSLAQVGGTRFSGSTAGDAGEARTRIQFLTIDLGPLNGGVQGFFRVYQGTDEDYVSASLPTTTSSTGSYLELSRNCGDSTAGGFLAAFYHDVAQADPNHNHGYTGTSNSDKLNRRLASVTPGVGRLALRCYLGGDSILTAPGTGANWPTSGHRDGGSWVMAPAGIRTALAALGPVITLRPDRDYLFPLSRTWNPNFKGVVYVAGKVILDGVIHGRVTVAASGNIIFGNDLTYYQNPATRDCSTGDIAGYFSGQSIIVSNNTINAPQTPDNDGSLVTSPSGTFRTYDDTPSETIHGFFLTLKTFGAEEHSLGSSNAETCNIGGSFTAGRGCLSTYGGIIQERRGAVGMTTGKGYIKRYQYDACGATDPPPYYPTTGFFVKNRFYELDPTRFNVAAWFAANQN